MSADDEFVRETREDLKRLTNGLVELEREGVSRDRIDELFRTAHSLKGNCSMAELDAAARLAHAVEDFLNELRDGAVTLEPELVDAALSAVDDIDTLLEARDAPGGASVDPEATATTLRERTERHRTDSSAEGVPSAAAPSDADAQPPDAESETEFDPTVEEALASASEFDDLDSLMDEMDSPEEEDDYESSWGTLRDEDEGGETASEDAGTTDDASESVASEPSESTTEFDDIKRTVETDPISNLDRELEDVEFGEFDDDDDLSIQELVEGDLDDDELAGETESDPVGASEKERPQSPPSAGDGTADEPGDDPPRGVGSPDEVRTDDPVGDPFGQGAFGADDSSATAGASSDANADDGGEEFDPDLLGGGDPTEDGTGDDPPVPPFGAPEEAESEPEPELPPDATEGLGGDDSSEAEIPSDAFDLSGGESDPDGDFGAADVELGDDGTDLPDLDDFEGADSMLADADPDVSFARDEHTVEFESRFAERFGEGDDAEDAEPLVRVAASTIEESNLDSARFRSVGGADGPVEFGSTDRSDRIQSISVDVENADTLLNLVEELSLTQLRLKRKAEGDVDEDLSSLESLMADLRRSVMELRLMPLSTATEGLPRVVRNLAREQDKRVSFEVRDEGVHLDRSIVDRLGDPLVHIVRNAVDHGIEPPEERVQKNKPEEATIELRAWRDRGRVFIEVEDDGRGISAERVRQRAIANDIVTEQAAETMPLDEVYDLIFEPGFTTTDEVTDVSGRGVGMDAVRRTVNSLDGTATVRSEPDAGTTVRLSLPVSVAVSDMLFVGVGAERYAIPASTVEGVEPFDESTLVGDDAVAVDWSNDDWPERLPLVRLGEAFDVPDAGRSDEDDEADERVLVRLHPDTRALALLCDTVDDAREVVVKPYEKLLGDIPGVSGATMSGDGTLVNIIDVATL